MPLLRESAAAFGLLLFGLTSSYADTITLLNTSPPLSPSISGSSINSSFSEGIEFSSGTAVSISEIEAYLYYSSSQGNVTLGIMGNSASNTPDGTFLDSLTVAPAASSNRPNDPVDVSSLNWAVSPSTTYWLVAVAQSGFGGFWQAGSSASTGRYWFRDRDQLAALGFIRRSGGSFGFECFCSSRPSHSSALCRRSRRIRSAPLVQEADAGGRLKLNVSY